MSWWVIIVIAILAIYVGINLVVYFFQDRLFFRPEKLPHDYAFEFDHPFQEVFLPSHEANINCLHFQNPNAKGAILYLHGNADNLERWGYVAYPYFEMGFDVLVIDYRQFGKSTGTLSEKNLHHDIQVCYNYLNERFPEDQIIIYGRSIGTGLAVKAASLNNPGFVVLEAPFYRFMDVIRYHSRLFYFDFLLRYRFRSYRYIRQIDCPILMFHGNEDEIIPLKSAQKLDNHANDNSTLIILEGGNHGNLSEFETYWNQLRTRLNQL